MPAHAVAEDGQVTAQGAGLDKQLAGVAHTSTAAGDESAITGGTRAYRGALGTVVIKSAPSGDTITNPGQRRARGRRSRARRERACGARPGPHCLMLELFDRTSHTGGARILGVRLERE
jgi:hypothetical protein